MTLNPGAADTIRVGRGEWYESVLARRIASGEDVVAPARFVLTLHPRSVLDAGCGTGHLSRFLAEAGVDVLGFDIDPEMLEPARLRAPQLNWLRADIATIKLDNAFDVVLVAGNVFNFVEPSRLRAAVLGMAAYVAPSGHLCASFRARGSLDLADYRAWMEEASFTERQLSSDWCGSQLIRGAADIVTVHQRSPA